MWDVDPRQLDAKRDEFYIITRVAEKGAWSDVIWLKKTYGVKKIKKLCPEAAIYRPRLKVIGNYFKALTYCLGLSLHCTLYTFSFKF